MKDFYIHEGGLFTTIEFNEEIKGQVIKQLAKLTSRLTSISTIFYI